MRGSRSKVARLAVVLIAALWAGGVRSDGSWIARGGKPQMTIRVAVDASPVDRTAARELAVHLKKITGKRFRVTRESAGAEAGASIYVGWTRRAAARLDLGALGPEEWVLRTDGADLLLVGGRARGTLYAVFRFLEDELGVRWWTPFDDDVPRAEDLPLPDLDVSGKPAFVYRDVYGIAGQEEFAARNRLNGRFAAPDPDWGPTWQWGPPKHVHNFEIYVPKELYFAEHPEFYSELGGLRFADRSQLCLTNDELLDVAGTRLESFVALGEAEAARSKQAPPRLYDFSQNDWGRACMCPACAAMSEREGSRAAPLIGFVNRLADRLAASHPDLLLSTLAYNFSVEPPRELRARDNVVIRFAGLYQRDFSKPLSHPAHESYRRLLAGWAERTKRLWVWDYLVTYGEDGDLPLPNLGFLAGDCRFWHENGVEGVYIQQDPAVAADLLDLKLWVLIKLLEDPYRDAVALVRDFTDGYYGPAGAQIRRYLHLLDQAAASRPTQITFAAEADDFEYIDLAFVREAHRIYDDAEQAVQDDRRLLARVRHARLMLDLATLARWPVLEKQRRQSQPVAGASADSPDVQPDLLQLDAILQRARTTWLSEVRRRLSGTERYETRQEAKEYLDWYRD